MNRNVVKGIALTVSVFLVGCAAEIRAPQKVEHDQAQFRAVGHSECGYGGENYWEYSTSKAALEAGSGTRTGGFSFGVTAGACDEVPPRYSFGEMVTNLSADTTYFYRLCGRSDSQTPETKMCTNITQFTTRYAPGAMQRITVNGEHLMRGGQPFKVFGLQPLDHGYVMDFFQVGNPAQRQRMEEHVENARTYGANTMRIHLDLFDFVSGNSATDLWTISTAFNNLLYLLDIANQEQLYLLISGNNVWLPGKVPAWYDALPHSERWKVQEYFFEELAKAVANSGDSAAVLGYELASEPAISTDPNAEWYAGYLGGWYFVPVIARGVSPSQIETEMRDWISLLSAAIKRNDPDGLVTIGALPFSGGPTGVANTEDLLDFLSPHIYPGDPISSSIDVATAFATSTKPVVIGETGMLGTEAEFRVFLTSISQIVNGAISFYAGYGPSDSDDHGLVPGHPPENKEIIRIWLEILQEYRSAFLQ